MKLPCPHCTQILELTPEGIASYDGDPYFPCPVCGGRVPLPEDGGAVDTPGSKPPRSNAPAPPENAVTAINRGLHRNLLVFGVAVLLLLGGAGIYLALTTKGDTHQTREERIREIIRNQYFTDLIASGEATKKELLALWDIRPYGVGFVGLTGKAGTWDEAAALAGGVGATVLRLDPPGASARTVLLEWLAGVTADLEGETHWVLDHGEVKTVAAPVVNRVTTMDRPRRVLLHWEAGTTTSL